MIGSAERMSVQRRKRGGGGVRELPSGMLQTYVQVGGKRYWQLFAPTEAQKAWDWIAATRTTALQPPPPAGTAPAIARAGLTFGDLASLFVLSERDNWSAGMTAWFHGHWRAAIKDVWEDRLAHEITPAELDEWLKQQIGRPAVRAKSSRDAAGVVTWSRVPSGKAITVGTVRKWATLMSMVFSFAVRTRRLASSPVDGVKLPVRKKRAPRAARRILTPDELRAILGAMEGHALAYFSVLAFTGLRQAEALRMRWRWIDLDAGVMRVEAPKVRKDEDSDDDPLPLVPSVVRALRAIGPGRPDEYVIPGWDRAGGRTARIARDPTRACTSMTYPLRKALTAAGLFPGGIGMHTFRRTCSTLARRLGVAREVVEAILRHAPTHQSDAYIIPDLTQMRAGLELLEAHVFPPAPVAPAAAPAEAAAQDVAHRDVKPANVITFPGAKAAS